MGNYEIFSYTYGLNMSLFALICLIISGFFAAQEKRLLSPISFLITAIVFDFAGSWSEKLALNAYEAGQGIETYVMFELLLFLVSCCLHQPV